MTLPRSPRALARAALAAAAPLLAACSSPPPPEAPTPRLTARDTAFLDTLEERTFRFFWETANPANGLVPDRYPTPSFSSIAAVGFGLTAYPIGVERGWVSRADARARVLTTLRWLWNAPQGSDATGVTGYKGFFYHFLGMQTGHRYQTVELSSIDTALLLGGVLFCQSYFDQPDPDEGAIRAYADSLVQRVDWQWMQHHAPPLIGMGWSPEEGFIAYDWTGYDEAMLLYVLALGSPTHGIDSTAWNAWTRTYRWGTFEGETYVNFPPLFGHQYSHVWIDFRGIRDAYMRSHGIDYFENSRRATRAQRAYAAANPMGWRDYSDSIWGLTASDGPGDVTHVIDGRARTFHGYTARGVSFYEVSDDGTIAPTAPGGSIAFAPEIAIPALVAMRERYDTLLFSTYGFRDAFNPTLTAPNVATAGRVDPRLGWFDVDYLGIDQGPILAMAENYRTELVWRYMRRNSYIVRGLRRAGFTGGWLDEAAATTRR